MLHSIPVQNTSSTGYTSARKYLVARPSDVTTDKQADAFVASLLAGRTDAVLVGRPVMGRDRQLRPIVQVEIIPSSARLIPGGVSTFSLT
jgi:hypothetical protein